MDPLPIFAVALMSTLFGIGWHNQPSRAESSIRGDDSASNGDGRVDWGTLVVWGFALLSFAALFLAGCLIWIKCLSDSPR